MAVAEIGAAYTVSNICGLLCYFNYFCIQYGNLFLVCNVVFSLLSAHGQRRAQYGAGVNQAVEFDCPEEFGYYPHPSDCTQYYVCVFGGALLESCTGGLMYRYAMHSDESS